MKLLIMHFRQWFLHLRPRYFLQHTAIEHHKPLLYNIARTIAYLQTSVFDHQSGRSNTGIVTSSLTGGIKVKLPFLPLCFPVQATGLPKGRSSFFRTSHQMSKSNCAIRDTSDQANNGLNKLFLLGLRTSGMVYSVGW